MNKAIPIRSFRSFQRYMGTADKFQVNSFRNLRECEQTAAGKLHTGGESSQGSYFDPVDHGTNGWLDVTKDEARAHVKAKHHYLAVRAIVTVPEAVAA